MYLSGRSDYGHKIQPFPQGSRQIDKLAYNSRERARPAWPFEAPAFWKGWPIRADRKKKFFSDWKNGMAGTLGRSAPDFRNWQRKGRYRDRENGKSDRMRSLPAFRQTVHKRQPSQRRTGKAWGQPIKALLSAAFLNDSAVSLSLPLPLCTILHNKFSLSRFFSSVNLFLIFNKGLSRHSTRTLHSSAAFSGRLYSRWTRI